MLKALVKVRLIGMFSSLSSGRTKKKTSGGKTYILYALLLVYVAVALGISFGAMLDSMCEPLVQVGLGWLYFAMAGLMAFAISFVFSIFATQSQLYEAKDNEALLSLPVPPAAILASRMVVLFLTVIFFQALVIIPSFVIWLRYYPVSPIQVISGLLCFLALPFLCLALTTAVGWVIARINSRIRRKTLSTTILSLVFLGAYFYFYSQINNYINMLVSNSAEIGDKLDGAISPVYAFGRALAEGHILSLLVFLGWCVLCFGLVYWLLSRSFIRIATANRGQVRVKYKEKPLRVRSARSALLRRELSRFSSSSVYMMNCGLGLIFTLAVPALLLIKRQLVIEVLAQMGLAPDMAAVAFGLIFALLSGMDTISAPSVSLEGSSLWIVRSLPVKASQVLMAKVNMHCLICMPPTLVAAAITAIALDIPLASAVPAVLLALAAIALCGLVGVVTNLRFPRLDWISETVPVKQGISVIITMLVMMMAPVIPGLLYFLLLRDILSAAIFLWLLLAVFILVCWLLYRRLAGWGARRLAQLG